LIDIDDASTIVKKTDPSVLDEKKLVLLTEPIEEVFKSPDIRSDKGIITKEIEKVDLSSDQEVYYVFTLQKKSKPKKQTEVKASYDKKEAIGHNKTVKSNKNKKSFKKIDKRVKIKNEQPVDPDNPFLALLELKNKLRK
jgi:hypothetical protein